MRKGWKRIFSITMAIAMAFTIGSLPVNEIEVNAAQKKETITIFHTNDVHGEVENLSYVKALKDATPNAILVDAGDSTQGSALATYSDGAGIISLMNYAAYDGMVLGNHEFDYGLDVLYTNAEYAKFPVVAANVYKKDGSLLLAGVNGNNGQNFIIEKAGKKIGFFGLTTQETAYKSDPTKQDGTMFADVIQTAQVQADSLKAAGCDLIVALAHVGVDEGSNPTTEDVARVIKGVDIIIDGHSHTQYEEKINGITLAQTGTKLATIGRIDITFSGENKKIKGQLLDADTYEGMVTPDAACAAVYNSYMEMMKPLLDTVVGKTTQGLTAYAGDGARVCRLEETVMGDIVADSMRSYGKKMVADSPNGGADIPVVALQNGGGVRANIDAGDITYGEVLDVLPYNNTLGARMVTPHLLYAALENGVCGLSVSEEGLLTGPEGRYPQISGMRCIVNVAATAYDPENPAAGEGNRVMAVYLLQENGTEILLDRNDNTTKIALVSNSFEISGGDGYIMLSALPFIAESSKLDCDILADYLRDLSVGGGFTFGSTQNRVIVAQQPTGAYIAQINTSGDGFSAGSEVFVSVDGAVEKKYILSADSMLTVPDLQPGAHTIDVKLPGSEKTISYFTSNLSGINVLGR